MLSTILELAAFVAFTAAAYLLGGLVAGLFVFGVCALVTAQAFDAPREQPRRARRIPGRPKVKIVPAEEPLTNAELDEWLQTAASS